MFRMNYSRMFSNIPESSSENNGAEDTAVAVHESWPHERLDEVGTPLAPVPHGEPHVLLWVHHHWKIKEKM